MSSQSEFDLTVFKKTLKRDKQARLTVVSDSMSPIIKVQEVISIQYIEDHGLLKVFDIVIFEQADRLNCHFLAKVDPENDLFVTKSIKNPSDSDYPLESKQILGIVKDKKMSLFSKIRLLLRT